MSNPVMSQKKKVLIVCLGNSCRSPIAEAVFKNEIKKLNLSNKWEVDSAAILGYHVGQPPEPRAMATLKNHEITDYTHIAKKVTKEDFYRYDWMFGMDNYIIENLYDIQPENSKAKIQLLGTYDPNGEIIIRDPLFDNDNVGFEKAYEQSLRSIKSFLEYHTNI